MMRHVCVRAQMASAALNVKLSSAPVWRVRTEDRLLGGRVHVRVLMVIQALTVRQPRVLGRRVRIMGQLTLRHAHAHATIMYMEEIYVKL